MTLAKLSNNWFPSFPSLIDNSPLKRERKVEARLIRPGIASILIPKQ